MPFEILRANYVPERPPELPVEGAMPRPMPALRAAWFGGMIEGPRGSDESLTQAVAKLNQLQLARVELEFDARQFSALIDEKPLDAASWQAQRLEDFVQRLQALVSASNAPGEVESNMRCVELYGDRVVETLFAVIGGEVLIRSQERKTRPSDEEYLARHAAPLELKRMGFFKKCLLSLGALLLGGALAWQIGLDNLFFARAAAELQRDTGYFGELLSMDVAPVFGGYQISLRRGPDYASLQQATQDLTNASDPLSRQAATSTVGTGAEMFVRLHDRDGLVLASGSVLLEALLKNADAQVSITLPGFRKAESLVLSTNRGTVER